jgi:hypothetical protein
MFMLKKMSLKYVKFYFIMKLEVLQRLKMKVFWKM